MTKLFVTTETICHHSEYSGEEYGSWSSSNSFKVNSVSMYKDRYSYDQEEFEVPFEVALADTVYVLHVEYSSGDSFGRSDGNGEVLWVFKDAKLAYAAKSAIEEKSNEYSILFMVEDGTTVQLSNPASGYFEDIQEVSVSVFLVENGDSSDRD